MTQDGEEYIRIDEAAHLLGVSRRTVERYADDGKLARYRRGIRREVFFKRVEVEALLDIRPEKER